MIAHPDELPDPAALVASTLSLMIRFIRTGCPRQASLILRQLAYLQSYPDHLISPVLKAVAKRLRGEWEQVCFSLPQATGTADSTAKPALH